MTDAKPPSTISLKFGGRDVTLFLDKFGPSFTLYSTEKLNGWELFVDTDWRDDGSSSTAWIEHPKLTEQIAVDVGSAATPQEALDELSELLSGLVEVLL